jgi:hypothetical protein
MRPFARPILAFLVFTGAVVGSTASARADIAFTRSDVSGASNVTAVTLADVDDQHGPDLLTVGNGVLQLRLNQGDGTFAAPSTVSTTTTTASGTQACVPFQIAVADVVGGTANLGGDGTADIVIGCASGTLNNAPVGGVLARIPGNGDGTFGGILVSGIGTAGTSPRSGETRFALAEWRESGPPVVVFPMAGSNNGTPYHVFCFSYDWVTSDCAAGGPDSSSNIAFGPIVAGEADGGDFDEVLTQGPTGVLRTFGVDTGTLGPPRDQSWGSIATGPGTRWSTIAIGDIQRDGRPDVVTTSGTVSDAFVNVILGETLAGDPSGAPNRLSYVATPFVSVPRLVGGVLLDADGDERPDFVGAVNNGRVVVQRTSAKGTLGSPEYVEGTGFPGDPNYDIAPYAKADLNGDGKDDFVVTSPGASTIEVLLNGATPPAGGGGTVPPGGGTGTGGTGTGGTGTGTGGAGSPQSQPTPSVPKLVISSLRVKGRTFSVEVNLAATVRFGIQTCKSKKAGKKTKTTCKTVAKLSGSAGKAGRISVKAPTKLRKGSYRVTATAVGATSVQSTLRLPRP